jgi:DNA-binding NtrC family response regulator
METSIDPTCRVHVIAVSPHESDHIALAHIFGHTSWQLDIAHSVREASAQLFSPGFELVSPVILCEETLCDGNWKDLLRMTQELSHRNNLIVTATQADDRLWAEVLNLGAYDVLQKPFRSQEVFRTIGLAWTDRRKSPARMVARAASGFPAAAVA